jgi:hypothetical protein
VYERDSNSNTIDGVIDERDSFSYDSFGNLIQFDDDTNAVGPVNRRIFYTFDYRHRLELVEYDANVDGTVDSSGSLIYDNNANLISSGIETYFYDAVNNLTLREIDFNSDGVNINRRRYIFDSNGYLVTFERDNNGDDIVETRRTYQYVPVNRWSVFIN